jgi:hypothetical protein
MPCFARIINNVVIETVALPVGETPAAYYPAALAGVWQPCSAAAAAGWLWDGTAVVPPPAPTPAEVAAAAVVAMQVAFNTALTAGITVPNVPTPGANLPVATDFNSLTLVHGAYTAASAGLFATTPWQTPTGFVTLTAAQVITVGQAVLTFEQGCFGRLQTVTAAIETALASSPDPATQIAAIAAAAVWPTS